MQDWKSCRRAKAVESKQQEGSDVECKDCIPAGQAQPVIREDGGAGSSEPSNQSFGGNRRTAKQKGSPKAKAKAKAKSKSKKGANSTPTQVEGQGMLSGVASSVLMSILWIARIARFDLLRATGLLATKVTKWDDTCDLMLNRLVAYMYHTRKYRQVAFCGDPIGEIIISR